MFGFLGNSNISYKGESLFLFCYLSIVSQQDLNGKIEEFQRDISESMEMAVNYRLDSLENSLEEKKEIFMKLAENTENIKSEKEDICVYSEFKASVAEMYIQILEREV